MKYAVVLAFIASFGISGCSQGPFAPGDENFLQAVINISTAGTEQKEIQYHGNGYFRHTPIAIARPFQFSFRSTTNVEGQVLAFTFHGKDIPQVGSYSLASSIADSTLVAGFERWTGNSGDRFSSTYGILTIHESSGSWIAGTFTFEGILSATCESDLPGGGSWQSCRFTEADETLAVSGSFEAAAVR